MCNIPGKYAVKEPQKTAILGTAHIEHNTFNTDINDISTMDSINRIAATLYSLGT
jgi:hypothetical protein